MRDFVISHCVFFPVCLLSLRELVSPEEEMEGERILKRGDLGGGLGAMRSRGRVNCTWD